MTWKTRREDNKTPSCKNIYICALWEVITWVVCCDKKPKKLDAAVYFFLCFFLDEERLCFFSFLSLVRFLCLRWSLSELLSLDSCFFFFLFRFLFFFLSLLLELSVLDDRCFLRQNTNVFGDKTCVSWFSICSQTHSAISCRQMVDKNHLPFTFGFLFAGTLFAL